MTGIQNLEFEHIWLLSGLLLIPLLYWWINSKGRSFLSFFPLTTIDMDANSKSRKLEFYKALPFLKLFSLALFIIALSGPRLTLKEEIVKADGIDIIMALDVSPSMLALDFEPTRLEASKKLAKEFISNRKYDRIGIVIFSGEAFTLSPVTTDLQLLSNYIDQIQAGILKDGTALGNGLASAINRLKVSEAKSKVIILLTDGVNNSGYVDPLLSIDMAKEYGIKIYTIGVGTNGYAESPVSNIFGKLVYEKIKVELDEELLKTIAESTNGYYFRATDNNELKKIYEKIDKLEKTKVEISVFKRYSEEFRSFTIIALLILLIVFLMENTILRSLP
jgi:Ca-activated chloride channel family protein